MKAREINDSKIIGTNDYFYSHKETVYDGIQKYLQVTKMKSERTNLGNLIEAIEVNYFLELTLGKLFGPTKVVPEIFRRGN